MFGFRRKKAEVLGHWYAPVPNVSFKSQEIYAAIEQALKEQQVPGLHIARVEFAEGSILSDKRQYLRMTRERLVFDVCAAPFGSNYFFSCRFAEIPAVVHLWQLILFIGALGFGALLSFIICAKFFGLLAFFVWPIACVALVFLAIYTMRNAVAMGLQDLDATLLQIPVVNAVYEAWFRQETYYREDTRLMYLTVVEGVVKRLVEQETAAKGVKLLTEYEYAPILGELYRPTKKHLDQEKEGVLTDGFNRREVHGAIP